MHDRKYGGSRRLGVMLRILVFDFLKDFEKKLTFLVLCDIGLAPNVEERDSGPDAFLNSW